MSDVFPVTSTGAEPKLRVAVLFQRFGPYHHARLNAAGRKLAVWGVEACAIEDIYAWSKVEGAAAFTRVTLTDRNSSDRQWKQEVHRKMWLALDEIKPQAVVIPGWASVDAFSALAWCVKNNIPAVVMSESTAWDEHRAPWKERIKSRLVKLCVAGLAGGTPHADYLARLGLPRDRIFFGYDIVDNDYFSRQADAARRQASVHRREQGLPEKYFLASARFVEKKNLFRLIKAYARYRALAEKLEIVNRKPEIWDLVLLGDGPLKPELVQLIAGLGLKSVVHLPGFKQYEELPVYFALAQVFVHASTTEQWGLVVNEAMASGLPVMVSNRCGCVEDLVAHGVNGFTFDPAAVDAMAEQMLKMSADNFPLAQFGAESRRIIAAWGPERFAGGLCDAVTAALKNSCPRAGWLDRLLLQLLLRR
jgi:glycosyltransferase involved in cell wall biosynthesis